MRYLLSLFKFRRSKTPFFYNWEKAQFDREIEVMREKAHPTFVGHWDRF